MYYSFFIHSFTDGHLGCFQTLAVVNNAAMSTGCMYSFQPVFWVSSDILLGAESLGRLAVPFLIFEGTPYHFPQWLHQSAFPPTVQEGFLFSIHILTNTCCGFRDDGHYDGSEVESHCGFNLPDD